MKILLIGGSGFVGRHLAARLADHELVVPTRRRERMKHLLVLPSLELVEADVHDEAMLRQLMQGMDTVINLVGVLQGGEGEPYGAGFARAHVELPQKIVRAMGRAGVGRLLHMSALRADAHAPSGYLRSKAAGEAAVLAAKAEIAATVFRPSVIFGQGDSFLNLFARLLRRLPLVPLAGAKARFQPVWVEDVAAAFAASLGDDASIGRAYDLCGPRIYSLRELVAYAGRVSGHPRPILALPPALAYLQAWTMEYVPGAPLTRDNLRSMAVPSVCAEGCRPPFGLAFTPLEAIAPAYLGNPG